MESYQVKGMTTHQKRLRQRREERKMGKRSPRIIPGFEFVTFTKARPATRPEHCKCHHAPWAYKEMLGTKYRANPQHAPQFWSERRQRWLSIRYSPKSREVVLAAIDRLFKPTEETKDAKRNHYSVERKVKELPSG